MSIEWVASDYQKSLAERTVKMICELPVANRETVVAWLCQQSATGTAPDRNGMSDADQDRPFQLAKSPSRIWRAHAVSSLVYKSVVLNLDLTEDDLKLLATEPDWDPDDE